MTGWGILGFRERLWSLMNFLLRKNRKENNQLLVFGHVTGGWSVDTHTRIYEWRFEITIENPNSTQGMGIRELKLRIKRGNVHKDLLPKDFKKPYLLPKQNIDLHLYFSSSGGLEGLAQDAEDEEATLVVTDTSGNQYRITWGRYSTNV